MLNPFIDLLAEVIQLYIWCVIAWTIMATLISFRIVNSGQPFVQRIMLVLNRLCNPVLRYFRKFIPPIGGVDISPIALLLLLGFLRNCLYHYFYNL